METTNHPTIQTFHIEGVQHISPEIAFALLEKNEAILIDVREPDETKRDEIPLENVFYHPMSVILERLNHIAKNQNIILFCNEGVRSTKVANLMNRAGYPSVANLDGGLTAWSSRDLPYRRKLGYRPSTSGCGGGCSCNNSGCNC
ncbi:MAG TPA: rhodanese-like domain-containing protein [Salinivirgaceae bacterium]|nr:rhodanese-like domain-containing protein [Salinivirgaceae bacterium]